MPRRNKTIPHQPSKMIEACNKKRRYTSENEALEVATYQMTMKPSIELAVYHCANCGNWHLTSINKK